jgi:hypothetical protein
MFILAENINLILHSLNKPIKMENKRHFLQILNEGY